MTNDYKKGAAYRWRTDRNFRKRQKTAGRHARARRAALKRSGHRCSRCGRGGRLEYHRTPEGGRMLCVRCHRALHRRRGDFDSSGKRRLPRANR